MKTTFPRLHAIALVAAMLLPGASIATAQVTKYPTNEAIPLIRMDDVPLADAIKNLARQVELNYIIDPRVMDALNDKDNARQTTINLTWTNLTGRQALDRLLKEHGLAVVENPATSVARITRARSGIKSSEAATPVPVSPGSTNDIIPLIVMDQVPLDAAFKNLARQIRVRVIYDSPLPQKAEVSVRWNDLTARQAMVALADNYNLTLVEHTNTETIRIRAKSKK